MYRIHYIFQSAIFALLLSVTDIIVAQENYIIMDGVRFNNIKLWDPGDWSNTQRCVVREGDDAIVYTPYEVEEYGFMDGRIYYAREVMISDTLARVFLRRLVPGTANLYYVEGLWSKTYFMGRDSAILVEIPKKNDEGVSYHDQLQEITADCPEISLAAQIVSYKRNYMKEFFERYNRCEIKPFPALRFGFLAGYSLTKLNSQAHFSYLNEVKFKSHGGIVLGLFVDQPVLVSDFSLHAELQYSRLGFSYYYRGLNQDNDLIVQTSSLTVPVMCRYTPSSNKTRPFINAGVCYEFNFKNETGFYTASISQPDVIEINRMNNSPIISSSLLGYSVGCGLERPLYKNHSLSFEIRFTRLYKILQQDASLGKSGIHFITGINL